MTAALVKKLKADHDAATTGQLIFRWVLTAVVITLAAFGYWQWAWLALALAALHLVSDFGLGLVIAVSGFGALLVAAKPRS
jgi:hypothetical protein